MAISVYGEYGRFIPTQDNGCSLQAGILILPTRRNIAAPQVYVNGASAMEFFAVLQYKVQVIEGDVSLCHALFQMVRLRNFQLWFKRI